MNGGSSEISGSGNRWAVVLSGGEGRRLQPFVERWLGHRKPKQYCAFVGSRSMLRHTLDRASRIVPPAHTIVVLGKGHRSYLEPESLGPDAPLTIEQPCSCGTLPGIMLPAMCVSCCDPDATLLVLPSDHFIYPEARFSAYAREALRLAESHHDSIVLIGTRARCPETEYGWICPGKPLQMPNQRFSVSRVERFCEKPGPDLADSYYRKGYLWNTMILAVRVEALRAVAARLLPDLARKFETLRSVYWGECRCRIENVSSCLSMTHLYQSIRSVDFSSGLLQQAADRILVLCMEDIYWCDWGRPERIVEGLARIGKRPLFVSGETGGRPSALRGPLPEEESPSPLRKDRVPVA